MSPVDRDVSAQPHLDVAQQHPGALHASLDEYLPDAAPLPDPAGSGFLPIGADPLATGSGRATSLATSRRSADHHILVRQQQQLRAGGRADPSDQRVLRLDSGR
jgi:hypothetical protein